ncbi:hypothetical protein GOODEAATRI_030334 [Goodea atripinnis]|uniref:Uncharacterized protein n=1 Tax=Goodea atripinnis TaxID=208336 RepID=A0ABV0Q2D4_9TELE
MSEYFSLSDCDVVGFDLDHTLCRYHLKETSRVSAALLVHNWTVAVTVRPVLALGALETLSGQPAPRGRAAGDVCRSAQCCDEFAGEATQPLLQSLCVTHRLERRRTLT